MVVGFFVVVVPVFVVDVEVVPDDVVVGGGGHVSDTTTAPAGNDRLESGTPWGTCKVRSCAPSNRTVTVQVRADADGIAAMPSTAIAVDAVTTPTASFRLLSTLALFLPRSAGACGRRHGAATPAGRYWVTPLFATVNRSLGHRPSRSQSASVPWRRNCSDGPSLRTPLTLKSSMRLAP